MSLFFKVFAGSIYCGVLTVQPSAMTPETFITNHGRRLIGEDAHAKLQAYHNLSLERLRASPYSLQEQLQRKLLYWD